MDEMIEMLLARERSRTDPAKVAAIEHMMRSPEMKARLTEKTGDYWMTWVGLWKDLRLSPGQTWESTLGASTAVYRHHGPVPGEPGLVRFSADIVLEGEKAKAMLAELLGEMTRQMNLPDVPSKVPPVERIRREERVSVDTDPLTLRPRRARMETLSEMKMQGMAASTKREVDDYEFDWSAAGAGGP